MEFELLRKFGMTNTEIKVYLEITKVHETKIGPITKKTGLHRGTVYNALTSLIKKGFVIYTDKKNVRYYRTSGDKIFKQLIREKEEELKEDKEKIDELAKITKNLPDEEVDVKILFGVEAFKTLFLEIYDECKKCDCEYLFQGRGGEMQDAVGEGFYKYTQKLKKKMRIKCRVILSKETKNLAYHKYTVGIIKYLSTKVYSPINLWIYGDTVLFVLFKTNPLTSIKIKSSSVADGLRNYFETIWSSIHGGETKR